MSGRTLYELAGDVLALESLLLESGGELTPEIEQWMAEHAGMLSEKVDDYGMVLRELESRVDVLAAEEQRLYEKRVGLEKSVMRIKAWLVGCMGQMHAKRLDGKLFALTRQRNSKRPMTLLVDPDRLPDTLCKIERKASRPAIEALAPACDDDDATVEIRVDGQLVATMPPADYHVRLR